MNFEKFIYYEEFRTGKEFEDKLITYVREMFGDSLAKEDSLSPLQDQITLEEAMFFIFRIVSSNQKVRIPLFSKYNPRPF